MILLKMELSQDQLKLTKETLHKAQALQDVLEREFYHLKDNNLDAFESIQDKKNLIVEYLAIHAPTVFDFAPDDDYLLKLIAELRQTVGMCKNTHTRNALLIERKLQATKGALELFRNPQSHSVTETYDKLGKLANQIKSHYG